jgi:hypothetical protein
MTNHPWRHPDRTVRDRSVRIFAGVMPPVNPGEQTAEIEMAADWTVR